MKFNVIELVTQLKTIGKASCHKFTFDTTNCGVNGKIISIVPNISTEAKIVGVRNIFFVGTRD